MILIDWLSFTSHIDSVESMIKYLGLETLEFELTNGFYGYRDSYYYNGIRIHFNPRNDDMGILVEMSGKGCRCFESNTTVVTKQDNDIIADFYKIFDDIIKDTNSYNITRLDVAFDDVYEIIPIRKLGDDTSKGNFISKWREWSVINSSKGYTVEQGSMTSDVFLRIYDKSAEQGTDGHWIRLELQLRRERAFEFIKLLNRENIGELWTGVLYNYLRYVKPNKDDDNKSRWAMTKYWSKLIKNSEKIKLYTTPGEDYTVSHLHNYLFKQAGGALKTYLKIYDSDKLIEEIENARVRLNPKYQRLISDNKLKECKN